MSLIKWLEEWYKSRCLINTDDDWISCRVRDGHFEGAGDPSKLEDIIERFKEWVEQ